MRCRLVNMAIGRRPFWDIEFRAIGVWSSLDRRPAAWMGYFNFAQERVRSLGHMSPKSPTALGLPVCWLAKGSGPFVWGALGGFV